MTEPTPKRVQPNVRLVRLAWQLEKQTAELVTLALSKMADEQSTLTLGAGRADRPKVTGGSGSGGPVEAAVLRGDAIRETREELRDRLDGLALSVRSLETYVRRILGPDQPRHLAPRCDGAAQGYDGHAIVWRSNSKDPGNGWHDPACTQIAGPCGLCDTCRRRMDHWRRRHGKPPIERKEQAA